MKAINRTTENKKVNYQFPWIIRARGRQIGYGRTELDAWKMAAEELDDRLYLIKDLLAEVKHIDGKDI